MNFNIWHANRGQQSLSCNFWFFWPWGELAGLECSPQVNNICLSISMYSWSLAQAHSSPKCTPVRNLLTVSPLRGERSEVVSWIVRFSCFNDRGTQRSHILSVTMTFKNNLTIANVRKLQRYCLNCSQGKFFKKDYVLKIISCVVSVQG